MNSKLISKFKRVMCVYVNPFCTYILQNVMKYSKFSLLPGDFRLYTLRMRSLLKRIRTSQKLIFLYKVVEGLVPAIEPDYYLKKARPKRYITANKFENYQATPPSGVTFYPNTPKYIQIQLQIILFLLF